MMIIYIHILPCKKEYIYNSNSKIAITSFLVTMLLYTITNIKPKKNWRTNPLNIIKAQLFLDGRCIHHLRYSCECVGNHFRPQK